MCRVQVYGTGRRMLARHKVMCVCRSGCYGGGQALHNKSAQCLALQDFMFAALQVS